MNAFLSILKKVVGWLKVPDVADEAALRKWARGLARGCQALAQFIETTPEPGDEELDDKLAAGLVAVVENDATWDFLYGILQTLQPGDQVVIGKDHSAVLGAAEVANISPLEIAAIIKAILDILKMFRR